MKAMAKGHGGGSLSMCAGGDANSPVLDLHARRMLYSSIRASPGIHVRELQRRTGLAIGNLDYHLRFLEKAGLVRSQGAHGRKLFCLVGHDRREMELLALLRQRMVRSVLMFLAKHGESAHAVLADAVGCSPSSLTYHLKKIEVSGLVVVVTRRGRTKSYRLQDPGLVARLLIAYQESFIDRMVDNFVESWEP